MPPNRRALHGPIASRTSPALGLALALLLAGCAGPPRGADGPGGTPPPNLAQTPDAEPRIEPIRSSGPNRPYEILGRSYVPLAADAPFSERGLASWYGRKFHGRPTSSGEPYDMYAMTAAHKTMPIPSYARVRNPANGRQVIVRINDRGPFHAGRVIDLSYTAALKLGVLNAVAPVEVERLTFEAIRTGAWRGGAPTAVASDGVPGKAAAAASAPVAAVAQATAPGGTAGASAATAAPTAVAAVGAAPVSSSSDPGSADGAVTATDTAAAATDTAGGANGTTRVGLPRPIASAPSGFWMQLGAFRERDGALDFQRKVERELDWLAPLLGVFVDRELHRLQAGPYATRGEAMAAAERLRAALQLVPLVVERR